MVKGGVLFINLNVQRACLYSEYLSGVALSNVSCSFWNEILLVQYLTQVLMALAENDSFVYLYLEKTGTMIIARAVLNLRIV